MRNSVLAFWSGSFGLTTARGRAILVLVAGGGEGRENVPATKAKLKMPFGVDFDTAGNLYFVEIDGHRGLPHRQKRNPDANRRHDGERAERWRRQAAGSAVQRAAQPRDRAE